LDDKLLMSLCYDEGNDYLGGAGILLGCKLDGEYNNYKVCQPVS